MERQTRLQARVEAVLEQHLPPPAGGQDSNADEALLLLCTWADPFGGYSVLNREGEREKLKELQKAAVTLARLFRELDPAVRRALVAAARHDDGMKLKGYFTTDELGTLGQIAALPERIRRARRAAGRVIDEADDARRTNWRAASLVGECRDLWKRRTGRDAAAKALDPAAPFGRFLDAVLTEFGAGTARGAFNAWSRLHT